jgi:tetrahydromethanopterin:alpha-L-glutamate ligase
VQRYARQSEEREEAGPLAKRAVHVRFGVVTAWPAEDWHSRRLLASCARRGDAATVDPSALTAFVGDAAVEVRAGARRTTSFDAFVLARGLGRGSDPDVQFEIYRALEGTGALVMNRIDALLAAQDKLRTSWLLRRAGVPTPRAAVAQGPREGVAALAELGDAVVKPIAGSLGDGLERVRADRPGRRRVLEVLRRDGAVYLQAWVAHPGRDARLFVVGGRVAGAIERTAVPGEWRTNVERGARVRPLRVDGPLSALAVAAARELGLDWAGVDVVMGPSGPTVLEVNGNPGWEGILEATGEDMAEPIAEHVWARAQRRVGRTRLTPEHAGANHG